MRQFTLSKNQAESVFGAFVKLVESIEGVKGKALVKMMNDLDDRLFFAPASNKLQYHNCFPGGLVEHSLRVYKNLKGLVNMYNADVSDDSVKLVGLFHDLGKVGNLHENYYIPQTNEWKKDNYGEYYVSNPNLLYMDSVQRSLYMLAHFGVPLTEEEYQAILIHDGQYIEANKRYAQKECMLALLLHQADMVACKQEKKRWENIQ